MNWGIQLSQISIIPRAAQCLIGFGAANQNENWNPLSTPQSSQLQCFVFWKAPLVGLCTLKEAGICHRKLVERVPDFGDRRQESLAS